MDSPATGYSPVSANGFVELSPDATGDTVETILRDADWDGFDSARNLPGLRAALLAVEEREGVTDAHRLATAKLRERGALLRHPDGHRRELSSHALSPDGRYFAVGAVIGADYLRGGTIQIWEVATGRCVNMLDGIPGDVGWPTHYGDLQWSRDGRMLVANFSGCRVGRWNPFGDRVSPLAEIGMATQTGSREPVGFALDPDGSRIFLHYSDEDETEGSGVDACLVPLWFNGGGGDIPEAEAQRLVDLEPDVSASLHGAAMRPFTSQFSADGSMIWGFGEWRWDHDGYRRQAGVFCVDVAERELIWFTDTGFKRNDDYDRMAVSPDESMLVINHGETLEFLDPANGRRLAEIATPYKEVRLSWGIHEGEPRLAVIDAKDLEGVRIYEGTEHLCDLMQTPQRPHREFPDGTPFAWSPDGSRAACLNIGGGIEIMTIGPKHDYVDYFDVPEDSHGLWWGADDILIIAGPRNLMFRDLKTGETIGDFRFGREVSAERPLWDKTEDLGRNIRPDPTFALDERRFVTTFEEGAVIAPSGAELLDHNLAWSVDRRFAWPYRWGPVEPAASVAACFDALSPASQQTLAPLRDRPVTEPVVAWPPPDTATIDGLYAAIDESFEAFAETWLPHVMDATRRIARQLARAGHAEAAESWLRKISERDWDDHVRFKAEVALVLAANGNPRAGARLHCEAAIDASHGVSDAALPFVGSALGATFAALGRPEVGREWIERAITAIDPADDPWQHRLAVCWALLEGGLEDQARQLWTEGEQGRPSDHKGWLAHLLRTGREDLMCEFLYDVAEDWYSFRDAVAVFTAAGRADLMREFFEHYRHTPDEEDIESLAEADRNAVTPRPNEFDIAQLRERRAELLRAPSSRRRVDTIRLAWRAAACQHYGAVLDMLKLLPYQDYDDRPETAVRALWTALTGIDDDCW